MRYVLGVTAGIAVGVYGSHMTRRWLPHILFRMLSKGDGP